VVDKSGTNHEFKYGGGQNESTPHDIPQEKKIKTVLLMMNKQGKRLLPVAPPLVEMMDLATTDDELDYLIKMGTGLYSYQQAGGNRQYE
jgi:hypothetical protein